MEGERAPPSSNIARRVRPPFPDLEPHSTMDDILQRLTDKDSLLRQLEQLAKSDSTWIDVDETAAALKQRVKGQDHVVDDLVRLLWMNYAKIERKRPVANVLFVGPTGTGKTELAKALAEHFWGDEDSCLEFAGPELSNPESKSRLIGNPPGYKGPHGQLTRPVISNPNRLIVFDEIDKAHPSIYDLFLKMMGDGRVVEQGTGATADFTKSVIVLTSNAEFQACLDMYETIQDQDELDNAIKNHLVATANWKPEIMGRIDRVYVYKPLPLPVMAEIVALKFESLAGSFDLTLEHIDVSLILRTLQQSEKVKDFGVRAMVRIMEREMAPSMLHAKRAGARRVRLQVDADGKLDVHSVD